MGRPKKNDGVPTRERLLAKAIELFAVKGCDAVSVRDITRSLGLNEASLYNHYESKDDLLLAIFRRFEESISAPPEGSGPPPPVPGSVDGLVAFLREGGRAFFARQGEETRLIWRILMMSQYSHPRARQQVKSAILDLPRRYWAGLLESMKAAGSLPAACDCEAGGRIIAAVYIEYTLRAILDASWGEADERDLENLDRDLELAVRGIAAQATA